MRPRLRFHASAALLLLAAVLFAPAFATDEKKQPAAGPLEVTYYYLPG